MPQSEREFQDAVVEYAHLNGWLVHHGRAAQVREGKWVTPIQGDAGYVDLTMARGPLVIGAELKAEKGRLSEGQMEWEAVLRQAYEFRYDLWRPSDWDEIEQTLRRTT